MDKIYEENKWRRKNLNTSFENGIIISYSPSKISNKDVESKRHLADTNNIKEFFSIVKKINNGEINTVFI